MKEVFSMRLLARLSLVALVAALAVPAALAAAPARGPAWTRLSGPTKAGSQLGLLRKDGVLNAVWAQGAPSTISDTRLDPDGKALGTSVVASGFDGIGGLGLVGMADGSVRLFAAGGHVPGLAPPLTGINSYVLSGSSWSYDPSALWGGARANAADGIGAALAGDGQVVTSWGGAIVHVGLGAGNGADPSFQPDCCGVDPLLATDSSSGAVVAAWLSNGHDSGTYVQQVYPSQGARFTLPSGTTPGSSGLAARIGAPGTYVAFADGKKVALYQYGGATKTIASGAFRLAKVFAGPQGRLWIVWSDGNTGIDVTRSNKAVTAFEPVQHLALPANLTSLYNAQGEGSIGALDLFVDVLVGTSDRGFWRTHVLAKLSLKAKVAKAGVSGSSGKTKGPSQATFTVTDAGDPVAGAIIAVRIGGTMLHLKTDGSGHASTNVPPNAPAIHATATAPGYANGIIVVAHGS
jgi:hypothetical protein